MIPDFFRIRLIVLSLIGLSAMAQNEVVIDFAHLESDGTGIIQHHNPVRGDLNYRLAAFNNFGDWSSFVSFQKSHPSYNGTTGVISNIGNMPMAGLSRMDGGPFKVRRIRFSGRPTFSGTLVFSGLKGPDLFYSAIHVITNQTHFEVGIDDSIIFNELRWLLIAGSTSPQIDQIVLTNVNEEPQEPSMRIDLSNANFIAVQAGPYPVGRNFRFEVSDDLKAWEPMPTIWFTSGTRVSMSEGREPMPTRRFYRVSEVTD